MKNTVTILSLVLLGATSSFAAFTTTLSNTAYNDWAEGGGEFKAVTTGASFVANYDPKALNGNGFQTFCVNRDVNFTYGVAYNTTLSSHIPGNPLNELSLGSAYLYSQFALGTLTGYDYATTLDARRSDSKWLQRTLWALEGQYASSSVFTGSNPFYNTLISVFSTIDAAKADALGAYGVKVMQLTSAQNVIAQSQLVYLGSPQPGVGVVPEPSTVVAGALLLLPFGVSTIRILRRKSLAKE
jgi:hypothetical protein